MTTALLLPSARLATELQNIMDLDPTLLDLDSEVSAKIMFGLDHRQHITIIRDTVLTWPKERVTSMSDGVHSTFTET